MVTDADIQDLDQWEPATRQSVADEDSEETKADDQWLNLSCNIRPWLFWTAKVTEKVVKWAPKIDLSKEIRDF